MSPALPRLRWVILGPLGLTGVAIAVTVWTAAGVPSVPDLLGTGVRLFLAVSFLGIGGALLYRLIVDGFDIRPGN